MPLRGASGSSVHLAGMHLGTLLHVPLLHTWVGMRVVRVMRVVTKMSFGMLFQVLLADHIDHIDQFQFLIFYFIFMSATALALSARGLEKWCLSKIT